MPQTLARLFVGDNNTGRAKKSRPRTARKKGPYHRDTTQMRADVLAMLNDPETQTWSNRAIAREIGCHHAFVAVCRDSLPKKHPANAARRVSFQTGEAKIIDYSAQVSKRIRPKGKYR